MSSWIHSAQWAQTLAPGAYPRLGFHARGFWGVLFLLVCAAPVTGFGVLTAQAEERLIHYDASTSKLNGGRTFYVVVRRTTETEFLVTDYDTVSKLVAAAKPDESVLKVDLFWPGKSRVLSFDADASQAIGVYLMLTNPRSEWKVLLPAPLRNQYRLRIDGFSAADTKSGEVSPANLTILPMPYPIAITHRPLTLFAGMLQIDSAFSFYHYQTPLPSEHLVINQRETRFLKPARYKHISLGQVWLRGLYGVSNGFQIGLSWMAGSYDSEGLNIGTVVAPQLRASISQNMAFDLSLPIDFSPFSMGATVGLPYRIIFDEKTALTLFEDFFSFALYSRFMDTHYADRVDAANGEFRLLTRFQRDINRNISVEARAGLEANAYNMGEPEIPLSARVLFLSASGFDISAGGGVFDASSDQMDYRFDLGISLRLGSD